jgi:hypothetical protein
VSALTDIQTAIYTKLTGDATLMSKVKGIFDHVPDTAEFPYVAIGDFTEAPWDSFSRDGRDVTVTFHIWSRYSGFKEAEDILSIIVGLLNKKGITLSNNTLVRLVYEFSSTLTEEDGITRHIPARFRVQVQKI